MIVSDCLKLTNISLSEDIKTNSNEILCEHDSQDI